MEEEVFLDAEEEITPRRSNRKRRSTAGNGSATCTKKSRPAKTMPTERSPKKEAPQPAPPGGENDEFWKKMGGMFGGLESRLTKETAAVREELGKAIGDLGARVAVSYTHLTLPTTPYV